MKYLIIWIGYEVLRSKLKWFWYYLIKKGNE